MRFKVPIEKSTRLPFLFAYAFAMYFFRLSKSNNSSHSPHFHQTGLSSQSLASMSSSKLHIGQLNNLDYNFVLIIIRWFEYDAIICTGRRCLIPNNLEDNSFSTLWLNPNLSMLQTYPSASFQDVSS